MIVKVTLPGPKETEALVATKDGKIRMSVTPGLLAKRFAPAERDGYFNATIFTGEAKDDQGKPLGKTTCILEVGDRLPAPEVPW